VQRLREELSRDPSLRAWIAAVWPGGGGALDEAAARTMGGVRAPVPAKVAEAVEGDDDAAGPEALRERLTSR
jgi:hypothetical protein